MYKKVLLSSMLLLSLFLLCINNKGTNINKIYANENKGMFKINNTNHYLNRKLKNDNQTAKTNNLVNEIVLALKKIGNKPMVRVALGTTIDEYVKKLLLDLKEEDKKEILELDIDLSIDNLDVENKDEIYKWIAKYFIKYMKSSIKNGVINNNTADEIKSALQDVNIDIPNFFIYKNMTEIEVQNLCMEILNIVDTITEPHNILKLYKIMKSDIMKLF